MKFLNRFSTILFSTATLVSCQKSDDTPTQPDKVTINITSLQDGQQFKKGDTVNIRGSVSYISQLHGYELTLKSKSTGKELFYYYEHAHGDNVTINQSWTDTLTQADTIQLILTAEIDHDGNQSTKELSLKSQP